MRTLAVLRLIIRSYLGKYLLRCLHSDASSRMGLVTRRAGDRQCEHIINGRPDLREVKLAASQRRLLDKPPWFNLVRGPLLRDAAHLDSRQKTFRILCFLNPPKELRTVIRVNGLDRAELPAPQPQARPSKPRSRGFSFILLPHDEAGGAFLDRPGAAGSGGQSTLRLSRKRLDSRTNSLVRSGHA